MRQSQAELANAEFRSPVTIPNVTNEPVNRSARLRQLQDDAERHVEVALRAVRDALDQAIAMEPQPSDLFEYGEAARAVRAALTAIRSARMSL